MEEHRLPALEPGYLINNRYEIVERIASGAMGSIIKVRDRALKNSTVVLKFLHSDLLKDGKQFERFRNEALVMRELTHPNIVHVYDLSRLGKTLYFISMEYVEGRSLRQMLEQAPEKVLEFRAAATILYEVALGMSHAHENGIIHRDLKPDNVLISTEENVKITDFGLAKTLALEENLTDPGETVGTPHYMSPEQLRGLKLDTRCDIYAFGIMAYELVAGEKPFREDNYLRLASRHLQEPLPSLPPTVSGVPRWYEDFLRQCTAKERDDRFQSFDEIIEVLGNWLRKKRATRATSITRRKAAGGRAFWQFRWFLRRVHVLPALAVVFFFLATGAGIVLVGRSHPPVRLVYGPQVLRLEHIFGLNLVGFKSILFGSSVAEFAVYDEAMLRSAVEYERREAVALMLAAGVPITADAQGRTALSIAAAQGAEAMALLILQRTPKDLLDQADNKGDTVVLHALRNDKLQLFQRLVQRGASVLVSNYDGETALMLAAATGDLKLVEEVLAHGGATIINDRNKRGKSALWIAKERGLDRIQQTLLESGAELQR